MKFKIFIFIIIVKTFSFASEITDTNENIENNLFEKYLYSIQFGLGNYLGLTSYQGSFISLKYHISKYFAIRAGLTINMDSRDIDSDIIQYIDNESNRESSEINDLLRKSISINSHFLIYPKSNDNLFIFYGLGPYFSYNTDSQKNDNEQTFFSVTIDSSYQDLRERDNELNKLSVGIISSIGFELIIYKRISLLAEYNFLAYYSREERIQTQSSNEGSTVIEREDISTGSYFHSQNMKLGISLYFNI